MKCAKFTTLGNRHSPPDASYGWVRLCQQTPAHNYLRINVVNMNLRCLSTQPPQPDRAPTAAESLVPNILRFALLLSEVAKLAPQLGGHAHAHSSNNHAGTRGSGTVGNVLSKFLCSHYSRVPCSARRMAEKFCQGKKIVAVHENEAGGGKRDGLPVCVQHGSGPQAF